MKSQSRRKWKRLTRGQLKTLVDVIAYVQGQTATFDEFSDYARSCFESIPGLENLTEREASRLVNNLWRDYMAKKPSKPKSAEKAVKKADKNDTKDPGEKPAEASAAPKKLDLDKLVVKKAIEEGLAVLKDGKSKADAAWAIYGRLKDEDKDLIVAAFMKGATLTEKGALTYWYNCKRKAAKEAPAK